MLRYLSGGPRPFGDYPMPAHNRLNWEFYAVLEGRLAPLFNGQPPVLFTETLWAFPPDCEHGWIGEPGQTCEVVVFHFAKVPGPLQDRAGRGGYLQVSLTPAKKEQVLRLAAELQSHYRKPGPLSEIYFERALMELSLLMLENSAAEAHKPNQLTAPADLGKDAGARALPPSLAVMRVVAAENWFVHHLPEQPTVADVARACGLSAGHLRRLFSLVRKQGAKEVLNRIRMERAMQLLAHSDQKLATIAAACGFAGASQFCHAFRIHSGTTPTAWRKHAYTEYRHPATSSMSPHEVLVQLGLLPRKAERATAD